VPAAPPGGREAPLGNSETGKDARAAMTQEKDPIAARTERSEAARGTELSADAVAAYLRRHPDFLLDRPELLAALAPGAERLGENVFDFRSFMIERLRERLERLGADHHELVITSRDNLFCQTRVHDAVLALLGASSFEQLVHIVTTDLAVILDLDVVTLCVEVAETRFHHTVGGGIYTLQPGTVGELIGGRDALLDGAGAGDSAVFGSAADLVRSSALLRLRFRPKGPVGLLALGSRQEDRFHAGQGTELLGFLARVLEHCVRTWLDLPG